MPAKLNWMVELKPALTPTVIVLVPFDPCWTDRTAGEAEMVKPGGVAMVSVTVAV
jgi:hypothetical protein